MDNVHFANLEINGIILRVSTDGSVEVPSRKFCRWNGYTQQVIYKKSFILTPVKNGKAGYFQVKIHNGGKCKAMYVHRLVWIAFNGPIPNGYEIDHLDEDKSNNRLSNLSLKTRKENMKKMFSSNPKLRYNLKQYM